MQFSMDAHHLNTVHTYTLQLFSICFSSLEEKKENISTFLVRLSNLCTQKSPCYRTHHQTLYTFSQPSVIKLTIFIIIRTQLMSQYAVIPCSASVHEWQSQNELLLLVPILGVSECSETHMLIAYIEVHCPTCKPPTQL